MAYLQGETRLELGLPKNGKEPALEALRDFGSKLQLSDCRDRQWRYGQTEQIGRCDDAQNW